MATASAMSPLSVERVPLTVVGYLVIAAVEYSTGRSARMKRPVRSLAAACGTATNPDDASMRSMPGTSSSAMTLSLASVTSSPARVVPCPAAMATERPPASDTANPRITPAPPACARSASRVRK